MKLRKFLITAIAVSTISVCTVFAVSLDSDTKESISTGLNDFATELLVVIPEASTQQNIWSDAYIGKVFPSFPPHLGGGLTIGGTKLDMTGFSKAANSLVSGYNSVATTLTDTAAGLGIDSSKFSMPNMDFTIQDSFFMPTLSADVRIGGLFLPFDIGICGMMTNPSLFSVDLSDPTSILSASSPMNFSLFGFDGSFSYLALGVDIRYAVLEGNLVLPKISVGGGYYYTKGGFDVSSSSDTTISDNVVQSTEAKMDMSFETQVMFVQAEVSKSFAVATVFGGARGLLSKSTNSWAWNYSTSNSDSKFASLSDSSSDKGTVSSGNGISDVYGEDGKWDFSAIQPQLFAGASFNFLVFQTSLSACIDVRNLKLSAAFSFHAKL